MNDLPGLVRALESDEPLSPRTVAWLRACDDPHLFAPLLARLGHAVSLEEELFLLSQLGRWPRGLDWSRVTASPSFRTALARHAAHPGEVRQRPNGPALLEAYGRILELGRREAPAACRGLLDALAAAAPFAGFPSDQRRGADELADLALDGLLRELQPNDAPRLEAVVRELAGMSACLRAADAWYQLSGEAAVPAIWAYAVQPLLEHEAGEDHYALIGRIGAPLAPYLADYLVHSDGAARNRTVRALVAGGIGTIRPLIELYRTNTDVVVREAITIALSKFGGYGLGQLERIRAEESRRLSRAGQAQVDPRSLSPADPGPAGDDESR